MKKTFTILAIAALSATATSQVITQNSVPNTVVALASVACGDSSAGTTSDNYYSRAFTLADYGINYDYKITNVAIGVENVNGGDFDVTLNLYSLVGTYPGGTKTLLSATPIPVVMFDDDLKMVSTLDALTQVIPAGSKFVVEVFHDGSETGTTFYMGANPAAQTKPSYLKSVACGLPNPVATGTGALGGFADAKWVMTITGVNNLGVTEIINSKDLQVYPNPVKDVLNFKMANNLQVESVELYDMTGRKVNTVNAKAVKDVNVSSLRKGTYILKVKANDGKVYVQKVLKD